MAQNRFKNKINNSNINIDYTSKDFISLKGDLISFAKTYFPNTYQDFNETSPGMMLMEMSAYVGDILSYYIDHQFKETILSISEERRNIVNIASMLGYKIRPIVPAVVELEFRQTVTHDESAGEPRVPLYGELMTFNRGVRIKSAKTSDIFFETIEVLDFASTGSIDDALIPVGQDNYGLTNLWEMRRKIKAVSGQTKVMNFNISNPRQFLELKIPDINVINIIDVEDSNGRSWFEVDYLAQDKILSGSLRGGAYGGTNIPTQYQLNPSMTIDRRFITKTNFDNTTSLIFGNGMMAEKYSSNQLSNIWQENEDINSLIQGNLPTAVNPLQLSDYNNSLGETPSHTTLTVTYRVGGGIKSNVSSNDLISITNALSKLTGGNSDRMNTLSVTNPGPARGGKDKESIDDIKQQASSFFAAQNRTVTVADYESRILSMP